ncbi:MAG: LysR family transcriptional regulator [Parasphingorhabdus sp.]|uniref:LysR family transcriptional regulator n=1 Tax=Parasphingorhabdus sp. TaxID=2709688 RepID=UPI00300232F1
MKIRDFDINLLTVLEAVWMTRKVTLAARSLNLGQSTVSAALTRLRRALNDELFIWSGNAMVPTPFVIGIMPEVVSLLDNARQIISYSEGQFLGVERRLVIATVDYIVALFGADLLQRAAKEAPNLSFDFVNMKPQFLSSGSRPDIDLLILPENALRVSGMEHMPLYKDEYVCIGAQDNAALYEGMSSEAFLSLRHIGYSAIPRAVFNHETMLWHEQGSEAELSLTMGNYLIFPRIVAESDAVAIMPRRLATTILGEWDIKWIIPPLPTPAIEIIAVWHQENGVDTALAWLRRTLTDITS